MNRPEICKLYAPAGGTSIDQYVLWLQAEANIDGSLACALFNGVLLKAYPGGDPKLLLAGYTEQTNLRREPACSKTFEQRAADFDARQTVG
jgi:hypothetical protein